MRFLLLVLGFALGVASTLVYATFASPSQPVAPVTAPLEQDPQLSVTLGEPLVAEIIKRSIAEAPGVGARPELRVALRDDVIVVDASVDVLGQRASGTATLRPTVKDGKLRVDVVDTNLGALQLPPLEGLLEKQINSRIASLLAGMPVTFTGARIDSATGLAGAGRTRGLTVTCRVDVDSLAVGLR